MKDSEQVLRGRVYKEEERFQQQYQSTDQQTKIRLHHVKNIESNKLKKRIQQIRDSRSNLERLSPTQVKELLEQGIIQVEESLQFLQKEHQKTPFLRRIFYPTMNQYALEQACRQLQDQPRITSL